MLTQLLAFASRNRRRVLAAGAVAGAAFLVGKFAQAKIDELKKRAQLEMAAKENIKLRFTRNLDDCVLCVLSELPMLTEALFAHLPVERTMALLEQAKQSSRSLESIADETDEERVAREARDKKRKLDLWGEFKMLCFTRTISAMYLLPLLAILLYTQLNLIGRYIYVDSVVSFESKSHGELRGKISSTLPPNLDRQYLSLSWHLMNVGWKKCVERVQAAIDSTVGSLPLSHSFTSESLASLLISIREKIEFTDETNETRFDFSQFLLPKEGDEIDVLQRGGAFDDDILSNNESDDTLDMRMVGVVEPLPKLLELLNETRDLLESPDFSVVFSSLLDSSMGFLNAVIDHEVFFGEQLNALIDNKVTLSTTTPTLHHTTEKALLPKLFPVLTRQAREALHGVPNKYVAELAANLKLQAWSAVVYCATDDYSC